jgi:protein-tyrosine-phosphatase
MSIDKDNHTVRERVARLSKAQCELVVARYDERTDWVEPYAHLATIYNKGDTPVTGLDSVPLPNVGREAHTYLTHIVSRWDQLADRTVFLQGSEPQPGMTGHLLPNASLEDYIFSQQDLCIFITYAYDTRLYWLFFRSSYEHWADPTLLDLFPKNPGMWPEGSAHDSWMWPFFDPPRLKSFDRNCRAKDMLSQKDFWERFVSESVPFPRYIFCAQGAQFSVSREQLQRKPRNYYEQLIEEMEYAKNPYQGHHFEYLWLYLLQTDEAQLRALANREPRVRGGSVWKIRPTAWALMAVGAGARQSRYLAWYWLPRTLVCLHPLRRWRATRRISRRAPINSVLFIGHDDTCVSPYAADQLRQLLDASSDSVVVRSAGLFGAEGRPAPEIAIKICRERGTDLVTHESSTLESTGVGGADLVVAMSPAQARQIERRFPGTKNRIVVLSHLDPGPALPLIREPHAYGGQWWRIIPSTSKRFHVVYGQVDRCLRELAGMVRTKNSNTL